MIKGLVFGVKLRFESEFYHSFGGWRVPSLSVGCAFLLGEMGILMRGGKDCCLVAVRIADTVECGVRHMLSQQRLLISVLTCRRI